MADRSIDDQVIKYADYMFDNYYMTGNFDYLPILWASASSSLR